MKSRRMHLGLFFLSAALVWAGRCFAGEQPPDDMVTGVSQFVYNAGKTDSNQVCEALALFGAKYEAAVSAAEDLSRRMILKPYGKKRREILCLVADGITPVVIEKTHLAEDHLCRIKIRYHITISDFVRADIGDVQMEDKESKFSWDQEMEQYISKAVNPGKELSRAYRYIRQGHGRIAVIYLDRLVQKYPYWADPYLARAIGYHLLNDTAGMMGDLERACALSNREACDIRKALNAGQRPPEDFD